MRIAKMIVAAGLLATGLSLAGCYNDHPGRWGDHHHGHHDRDHDRDHDHDGYR